MARALPPLLLALSLGGAPSHTLAHDCDAADVVSKEGQRQVINTTEGSINLFVKPENGFLGVRLDVHETNGTQHTAWFPAEMLFPHDGKWQQFQAWTNSDSTSLRLGFSISKFQKRCKIDNPPPSGSNLLRVVAYGPSKWIIKTPPQKCDITYLASSRLSTLSTCEDPPSTTTTTTTTPPTTTTTTTTTTTPPSGMPSSRKLLQKTAITIAVLTAVVVWWGCIGGRNL